MTNKRLPEVTLTHPSGAVVTGVLREHYMAGGWQRWTLEGVGTFYDTYGWAVTATVEVAELLPPNGTFIKGVNFLGSAVRGVVVNGAFIGIRRTHSDRWLSYEIEMAAITSWEVVDA